MNSQLFWRALAIQGVSVAILFGVLVALPLPDDFFEDYGWITGPVAWAICSVATSRLLTLPSSFVLFCAVAGGVAGAIVGIAISHTPGLVVGLLVFAASCSGYEERAAATQ